MTDTAAAAKFMYELLASSGELRQDDAAQQLYTYFGEEHVYFNSQGNLAIKADVLTAFRKLTPDVVWLKGSRYWRLRLDGDIPGREQPY